MYIFCFENNVACILVANEQEKRAQSAAAKIQQRPKMPFPQSKMCEIYNK